MDSDLNSQILSNDSDDDVDTDDSKTLTNESFDTESDNDSDDDFNFDCDYEQLYNNLFQSSQLSVNTAYSQKTPYVYEATSCSASSSCSDSISVDDIESFFNAPDDFLHQPTSAVVLCLDETDEMNSSVENTQIFVGCIPIGINEDRLKSFFNENGYADITDIHGPVFQNLKPGFAFVTFESGVVAARILYDYLATPSKFKLLGRQLRLSKPKPRQPKAQATDNKQPSDQHIFSFPLASLTYGTLIGAAAMQMIVGEPTETAAYGCIIHQLLNTATAPSWLKIDTKGRKFSINILVKRDLIRTSRCSLQRFIRFEWRFRDLKGNKFTPILARGFPLLNFNSIVDSIDPIVHFLCEIRRPPCISYITQLSDDTTGTEHRLPGSTLIGRANAWIFRIQPDLEIYKQLVGLLNKYRLCEKPYEASTIRHLLTSSGENSERFIHVNIVSMNRWNQQHQEAVEQFRRYRWPAFPFETKFEMMKLISKYIITINDLILDNRLESILNQMTQNVLVACIDKILEFAHLWQPTSEKAQGEDWNDEQEDENEESTPEEMITRYCLTKPLHSATGRPLESTIAVTLTGGLGRLKLQDSRADHFGSLSRLLCLGLNELHAKSQLYRTASGTYVTKQEIRKLNSTTLSFIRKVFITPSTIHYEGPHPEEQCAVTRQFTNVQDRFLRVSFRDEDYRKLMTASKSMKALYKHIYSMLQKGLNICGRKYEFLAFSSSQLREHSCWMFSKPDNSDVSCQTIRAWMGNFENIHPVAKMAARLGQLFSTTRKGKELSKDSYIKIDDVRSPIHRDALYTDGIGIITPEYAKELTEQMHLSEVPSAFQIRCGGYKGMVCLDIANILADRPKVGVAFRQSMEKFESENCSIDIVQTAHFSLSYLNRQMILLLSARCIPDSVFHTLQNEMIDEVMSITRNAEYACEILSKFNGRSGGNGTHRLMIGLFTRFGLHTERFTRQILQSFQEFQMKRLRTKAQILVENGCMLFGVVDETRTLKYGQVFIQIEREENERPRIIQGPVIVTRNPCLHPGDVRRYEAVDNSLLHNLKNVIVFPMDGPKAMAAELAGGDLDGDTFWISWDQRLLFGENYPALCYDDLDDQSNHGQGANQSSGSYNMLDVCRFFVKYIEADNLGVIATSHMALADWYGVHDKRCLELARMHSIAVDFVKTGRSPSPLTKEHRPSIYPSFMEKKDRPAYESTRILGQLYKEARKVKIIFNHQRDSDNTSFPYSSLLVHGHSFFINDARALKEQYDRELKRIMRHYGVHREGEIISGYITKFMSKQYTKEGKMLELRQEIAYVLQTMRNRYIQQFWEEFYLLSSPSLAVDEQEEHVRLWQKVAPKLTWHNQLDQADFYGKHTNKVEQKASAWFHVTYGRQKTKHRNRRNQREQLYSFAWLIYPVLFHIYDHHQNETTTDRKHGEGRRKNKRRRRRHSRKNREKH